MRPTVRSKETNESLGSAASPVIGVIVITAILFFARDLFIPLAMAAVLAVVFSPVAGFFERLLGRLISSVLVVVITMAAAAGLTYFLAVQLTAVAIDMTGH